jgi:hypothetical protein
VSNEKLAKLMARFNGRLSPIEFEWQHFERLARI